MCVDRNSYYGFRVSNLAFRNLTVADGKKGWPETAPYHAIHVGAAAAGVSFLFVPNTPVESSLSPSRSYHPTIQLI
jgi:hypothetical protein